MKGEDIKVCGAGTEVNSYIEYINVFDKLTYVAYSTNFDERLFIKYLS